MPAPRRLQLLKAGPAHQPLHVEFMGGHATPRHEAGRGRGGHHLRRLNLQRGPAPVPKDVAAPGELDEDCGEMSCYCVQGEGIIPGVCSTICSEDADCARHGDDYTCSIDFCTGVNVCLRQ